MTEGELLESTVSEYSGLLELCAQKRGDQLDVPHLIGELICSHDWSDQGARAILDLATEYGAFMLRNALALAIVLGKEDGELGF